MITTGVLAKAIKGFADNSGNVIIDNTLTFNNGAEIGCNLNLNDGILTISEGSITEHNVRGKVSGNADFVMDIDFSDLTKNHC